MIPLSSTFRAFACPHYFPPPCAHRVHVIRSFLRGTLSRAQSSLINAKIPYKRVRIVDSNNKLSPTTQSLSDLLASLDLKKSLVELVSETPEPIVRVSDRREAVARYKEQKKAHKEGLKKGHAAKEIQLSWTVAPGDLQHKLAKARTLLDKGHRVDIVFASKGDRGPGMRAMQMRAHQVTQGLGDIAKEWKPKETTRTMMIMSFRRFPDTD
ncbi:hypothetical protein F5I97DRAFT_959471 [Phlebopus sp. FC_14]|nr:hypothetical protein F5I97DRAFT_959471 [Phlebopus sp. FC_14]